MDRGGKLNCSRTDEGIGHEKVEFGLLSSQWCPIEEDHDLFAMVLKGEHGFLALKSSNFYLDVKKTLLLARTDQQ